MVHRQKGDAMKNVYTTPDDRHEARHVWRLTDFTLDFTDRERYKKAVRILMNSSRYKLIRNGRYLYGNAYGYVTFRAI